MRILALHKSNQQQEKFLFHINFIALKIVDHIDDMKTAQHVHKRCIALLNELQCS